MVEARFDTKLFNHLRKILKQLNYSGQFGEAKLKLEQYFDEVPLVEIILIAHELKSMDEAITTTSIKRLFTLCHEVFGYSVEDLYKSQLQESGHPVQVFNQENKVLLARLDDVIQLIEKLSITTINENAINSTGENVDFYDQNTFNKKENLISNEESSLENSILLMNELKEKYLQLGRAFSHYHRKEKLFFPILERYGHFTLARMMWADDDQIRNLYKGTKNMIDRLPKLPFKYVQQSFNLFKKRFKTMMFEEELFLLPVLCHYFTEEDWLAVAKESDAYGFATEEFDNHWIDKHSLEEVIGEQKQEIIDFETTPIPFGGGYLTIKEADEILNNLPVEITFVDKFGVFKYFNDKVKSSEMMFIRTPSSIGRNVGHCHPPKSMQKVAQLISDLKTKRRIVENMWFKQDGRYVHITYKGLFDKDGEYLGILEYVQDIKPFLELPREVKKEITKLDHVNPIEE